MLGLHHKYFLEHGNLHEQGATGRAKGAFIYSYFFPTSLLFVEEEYIRVTRIFFFFTFGRAEINLWLWRGRRRSSDLLFIDVAFQRCC